MKKMIIASICVALGVVLSTTSIPIGPARIFPFQHMINVILAVIVGARFSVGAAFSTSCLRNVLALGSPLAFPGSMIGAWLSAYLYNLVITLLYNLCNKIIDGARSTSYNEAIMGCSHKWAESKLKL